MPDTIDDEEEDRDEQPPEQLSVRRRMAWFFGIAAVSGVAFAAAAGLLRWLLVH